MRALLALVICAGCTRTAAKVTVIPPQQAVCPPPVVPKERGATSVALQQELDEIDQELDAIDNILIAAERASGLSQLDAIEAATRRQLQLRGVDLAMSPPSGEEPLLMARIRTRYLVKRADVARLATELGQRHPEMVAATQRLDQLRADYERQREIEIGFAKAWQHELTSVPPGRVPKEHVHASRMRALAPFFASSQIPSDAPAPIVLAAIELAELRYRRDEESAELGPKHPEMLALTAEIAAAERSLREAIEAPVAAAPPATVDGKLIARRAALATRARILRADLRRQ